MRLQIRLNGTPVWLIAVLVSFVFSAAWISIALTQEAERTAFFWFANAGLLAAILRQPHERWGALLLSGYIANVMANIVSGDALIAAFLLSFCNIIEVLAGALLLRRFNAPPSNLTAVKGLALFIVLAGFAAPALSTVCASALPWVMVRSTRQRRLRVGSWPTRSAW